jgi:hemoglobin-like flavoprotein
MGNKTRLDFTLATDKFYEVLFERMPSLETLFGDKKKQECMFIVVLQTISDNANGDIMVSDYLKVLGEKHKAFGLRPVHMEMGRQAFEQAIVAGGINLNSADGQFYMESYDTLIKWMRFDYMDSIAS